MSDISQPKFAFFSHHKCATSYCRQVIAAIASLAGLRFHKEAISSRLPLGYESDPLQIARLHKVNNLISDRAYDVLFHGNADEVALAALAAGGPLRGVHVIRDPRDILVSGYFWHTSPQSQQDIDRHPWTAERQQRLLEMPDVEAALILDMQLSGCYFAALRAWNYDRPDMLELRYEEMARDASAFFMAIMTFWGLALADGVDQVLKRLTFEKMSAGRHIGQEDITHKYRKGVAGDWRNHFTPRVTDAFKQQYGDLLVRLGYERDLDWTPGHGAD